MATLNCLDALIVLLTEAAVLLENSPSRKKIF
jgi:hypothetical protein